MAGTVDWGIDLGTTNSAIARMTPRGPELVQVQRQNYIPSAVAVDKRGDVKVGSDALNAHLSSARWFKRLMGTKNSIALAGADWTPDRLSAEILKALRAAAKRRADEDIEEVVITVPAMFSQPQCAATHDAARLAGLDARVLLQEPIAAATAYLSENAAEGHYLVYDLGGGTFDVSLIRLAGGEMSVIEHGGDNYLGGSDFDRAIFDWALDQIDRRGGDVRVFGDGWQRAQLLLACEEARMAVSDDPSAPLYLDEFDLPIAKLDLTRTITEDLIANLVTRTIQLARDRLKAASGQIRSILLVGGPTQMPYIRRRLQSELGLPLALDKDPMTVVAAGAAVHAGALLRRQKGQQGTPAEGSATLDLKYDPVSTEQTTTVAGKVVAPRPFAGEIRIRTSDGAWESGWRSLVNGAFSLDVSLGKHQVTEYGLELRDLQGRTVPCQPSGFAIRSGIRAAQPVTPYNYGVVRQEGKVGVVIKAGEPLPASGTEEYSLAGTIVAGSPHQLTIYFVEGNSLFADENVMVGTINIRGSEIDRTLKQGERLEVRVRMDESRRLKATVYIPLLDKDYSMELRSILNGPDIEDLLSSFREARQTITQVEGRADEHEQTTVVQANRQLEQLEALLVRVEQSEIGEADRVQKQLSDVKASLRPLRDKYGLTAKHEELVELIGEAEGLCRKFSDQMGLAKLGDAREDAAKALRLEQEKSIESIRGRVLTIFWEHYGKTRECWEYQVSFIASQAALAKDPLTYYEHLRRAETALSQNDYEGVRLNVLRARDMLPEASRFSGRFRDVALR